jgi:hypothetical protein
VERGEVDHAIRGHVLARVADFVEELLLHTVGVDAPAGAGMFGHGERSVRLGFHDGVADVGQVRDVLPVHLTVAAGALRAALDDVSGDDARGELVIVLRPPAEAVDHGREHQSGVGAAARDHHVRAGGQRLC